MSLSLHVAVIMDGNGRWAQQQGKPRSFGHEAGVRTLKEIVKVCPKHNVKYLTVYAFSPDNWKRSKEEVSHLMKLLQYYLKNETRNLHKEGVCLRIIGAREHLSDTLQKLIQEGEALTQHNTRLVLQIALNYGGREDLLQAMRCLANDVITEKIKPEDIEMHHITEKLYTHQVPDPDLLIRTGGEMRLSNYLLWQMSYTEFVFLPQYWPSFTPQDFAHALDVFHQRQRRYGAVITEAS